MEIVVNIEAEATGRLIGTVSKSGGSKLLAFSGAMEFLAAIESLCRPETSDGRNQSEGELRGTGDD